MSALIFWIIVLIGCIFFAIAGLGLLRFPDAFCRMHAVGKASSFGMSLILIGLALSFRDLSVTIKCILTIFFIYLTTPVATHLLCRAALLQSRSGLVKTKSGSQPQEWTAKIDPNNRPKR